MPQLNYLSAFRTTPSADIDRAASSNALMRNQVARIPQQNRAQDLEIQRYEQDTNDQQKATAKGVLGHMFSALAQSQDPIAFGRQMVASPDFVAASKIAGLPPGFTVEPNDDPKQLVAQSMDWARAMGAGLADSPEDFTLSPGSLRFNAQGQVVARGNPQAESQPRQAEPPVSVVGPNGKPVYVSREESLGQTPYEKPSGGLSPRDATTARNKLTMIQLARQQVALARQKFQPLKGTFSAGPLGAYMPTQAGQAFDAAVDVMRGTIGGITRVPGVGSMSDYEGRLDQAKMPARGKYEATTEQQLDSLDTMLNYLEQGYGGLLSDNGAASPESSQNSGGPQVGQVVDGYRFKGGDPGQQSSWEKQ